MPSGLDSRLHPLKVDHNSNRHFELKEACDLMTEEKYNDWPVDGPMSTPWVSRYSLRHGGSFVGSHLRWMSEVRLDYSAAGCSEDYGWAKFFDTALGHDQFNLGALACMEIGARRMQMIRERWRH